MLGCGKAGGFSSSRWKPERLSYPARLHSETHSPTKDRTRPHSPIPDLAKRYKTGWDPSSALGLRVPFLRGNQFVSDFFGGRQGLAGTSANSCTQCHPAS